ncbi:hypothetical protein Tco_1225003 [Tanacetum coccineum]
MSVGVSGGPFPLEHTPCVRELDASSDVRRPNELKRNVVEQDVPFKRMCVRSLDLFSSVDQQPADPSLRDSNELQLSAASERVVLNPVIATTSQFC